MPLFKKNKQQDSITPEELSRFNDKSTADPDLSRFHVKTDAAEVVKYDRRKKKLAIILSVCIAVLIILFIISMLLTQWGDLVISVDSFAGRKGIILSEDPDFKKPRMNLSAKQVKDVTNMTYSWLPKDLDTSENGSHNGKNYVAYTFYCKNNGQDTLDYDAYLEIVGVAKSADEAVRVMVYKNGEPAIYGKASFENRKIGETDCTMFVDDTTVMLTTTKDFEVDEVDKYTVVIWAEGNDPECLDDIRGGHVRMRMMFEVHEEEGDKPDAFGADVFN